MTTLPYKKRIMASLGEQVEPLDLSVSAALSPLPSISTTNGSGSIFGSTISNLSPISSIASAISTMTSNVCNLDIDTDLRADNMSSSSELSPKSMTTSGVLSTANGLYRCPDCTHTFMVSERLRAHQRRHKIKESGRYTCGLCNKSFVQQSSLITHKRIHTGERPYHCKICENRYGDLSTFTKHKRTHSGEKPYKCGLCERRFSQSGNCLRHTRSVHAKKL